MMLVMLMVDDVSDLSDDISHVSDEVSDGVVIVKLVRMLVLLYFCIIPLCTSIITLSNWADLGP